MEMIDPANVSSREADAAPSLATLTNNPANGIARFNEPLRSPCLPSRSTPQKEEWVWSLKDFFWLGISFTSSYFWYIWSAIWAPSLWSSPHSRPTKLSVMKSSMTRPVMDVLRGSGWCIDIRFSFFETPAFKASDRWQVWASSTAWQSPIARVRSEPNTIPSVYPFFVAAWRWAMRDACTGPTKTFRIDRLSLAENR